MRLSAQCALLRPLCQQGLCNCCLSHIPHLRNLLELRTSPFPTRPFFTNPFIISTIILHPRLALSAPQSSYSFCLSPSLVPSYPLRPPSPSQQYTPSVSTIAGSSSVDHPSRVLDGSTDSTGFAVWLIVPCGGGSIGFVSLVPRSFRKWKIYMKRGRIEISVF